MWQKVTDNRGMLSLVSPIRGSKAGFVIYVKPGWGIDTLSDSFEREWLAEVGVRWMWDEFPLNRRKSP